MKGNLYNILKLNGLEDENTGSCLWKFPGVNPNSENHFLVLGHEEQSPEQAGAEEASFFGASFLAASL